MRESQPSTLGRWIATLLVGGLVGYICAVFLVVGPLETQNAIYVRQMEYDEWRLELATNRIAKLEKEVSLLRDTEYYDELWVGKSPTNNFMVYLKTNNTINILYQAEANHECLNWALEHAAPNATIYLQYKVFAGTIDLTLTEWSVTIR